MKIVYSLPHPADRLDASSAKAGHIIRALAIIHGLEQLGHQVVISQAAPPEGTGTVTSGAGLYRNVIKKLLPRSVAMKMRDAARISFSKRYAQDLIAFVQQEKPDVILQTHIAFSLAGKLATEATSVPLVLDDVAPAWEEQQQYGVGLAASATETHIQTMEAARLIVAVGPTIRELLIKDGVPAHKIVVVPNGIDEDIFRNTHADGRSIRQRYGIDDPKIVVGYLGSFQPYHRVDLLVQALAHLVQQHKAEMLHVLLVGGGARMADIQEQVDKLALKSWITFTDKVPYTDVAQYIAAFDIAVAPANSEFANLMKVHEYGAMGKPIIAPDQPSIRDQVAHNETAYLFKREDPVALADAIYTLATNSELRQRLGEAARQLAGEATWVKRAAILANAMQHII